MIQALLPAALALAALSNGPAVPAAGQAVALKAGTIYLVEGGKVLEDGGTILVRDGVIAAVGKDLELPVGTRVIDYGPSASIAPGLVADNSYIGPGRASERTADPSVRAIDNFDPYSEVWAYDLAGGVTTLYMAPARGRLIAGQGAVVKLAGDGDRVLSESASLHGSVGPDARGVGGYWEPPVPATSDVGLGVEQRQLPGTTMGAVLALRELLDEARNGRDSGEYGPGTPAAIAEHLRAGTPWRLRARSEAEILAALGLIRSERLKLVIEGADEAAHLAQEIKASGASVVVTADVAPGKPGRDFGRGRDSRWPSYSAAAALADAGVPLAIASPDTLRARDLRFAASVASRGGLTEAQALRAITLGAAEVLGVADRVGSITPGKDADFAVFSGEPMSVSSSVLATWIGGAEAFTPPTPAASKRSGKAGSSASAPAAVVIEAEQLHVGDGEVLTPGQVLIVDGKIVEVGRSVGRPFGAALVKGAVAMPGLIDALGHLGLEGSGKTPDPDFKLARIVEPGDFADRRVARAGVTTVVMSPRAPSRSGAPMLAYKPAASHVDRMIVEDPAALRVSWSDQRDRNKSGEDVKKLLEKALEYDKKWKEYEEAMSEWTPPPAEPEEDGDAKDKEDDEDEDADEKADEKDKKKKKKQDDDEDEDQGDPLTGVWDAELTVDDEASRLRLRIGHEDGKVSGTLRCDALSETLIVVAGSFEPEGKGGELALSGLGSKGFVELEAELKKGKLSGSATLAGEEHAFEAERTSEVYEVAGRSEVRKEPSDDEKAPKGKPKSPGIDEKLEPVRAALRGEKRIVVTVDLDTEILECVDAFEAAGVKPVLYGAQDAWRVKDQIKGRVSGVLPSQQVLRGDARQGLAGWRNTYQELAGAGIHVAFHSAAEEGASELWLQAAYAVSQGLSPSVALRALTSDSAAMMGIDDSVGTLAAGKDGDVLLLDGPPLDPATSVLRVWVAGEEVQ